MPLSGNSAFQASRARTSAQGPASKPAPAKKTAPSASKKPAAAPAKKTAAKKAASVATKAASVTPQGRAAKVATKVAGKAAGVRDTGRKVASVKRQTRETAHNFGLRSGPSYKAAHKTLVYEMLLAEVILAVNWFFSPASDELKGSKVFAKATGIALLYMVLALISDAGLLGARFSAGLGLVVVLGVVLNADGLLSKISAFAGGGPGAGAGGVTGAGAGLAGSGNLGPVAAGADAIAGGVQAIVGGLTAPGPSSPQQPTKPLGF